MSCKDNSLHQITNKIFFKKSGTHLLSHTVTSIVPSAAYVLTIVFGMGTGVTRKRIGTEKNRIRDSIRSYFVTSFISSSHSGFFFPCHHLDD